MRDSQLLVYMDKASIKLTEEQMRDAEEHYKQIDENKANADGVENVREDDENNDNREEEKKEDEVGVNAED